MRFRDRIANFMQGRYGTDDFSKFILVITLVIIVADLFLKVPALSFITLLLLFYCYFRMFSRNIYKRSDENRRFLDLKDRFTGFFRKGGSTRTKAEPGYKYFKCPNCKQKVRVPKGKGKIRIHCPKCSTDFIKKS